MANRKRIDIGQFDPFIIEHEGRRYRFSECFTFAEIGNPIAGITDFVMKTMSKEYFRLTVVSDAEVPSAYGVDRGWYVTLALSEADATKIRESWAVVRRQPDMPGGSPWA